MRRILTILAVFMAAAALAGEPQPPKLEVIEGSQTSARAAVRLANPVESWPQAMI